MSSRSSIVASLIIVVIVFGSVGGLLYMTSPYEPSRIAVVVMDPGFGDLSYADQLYTGLTRLLSYISVQYYFPPYPKTQTEAVTTLRELAQSGRYSLILAMGRDLVPSVQTVADEFPEQKFAMIDGYVSGNNVVAATFKVEQAAFVAGVFAALMAANITQKVGIIGSVQSDTGVQAMIDGFIQGVTTANETYDLGVTLLDTVYIGSYNNTELAAQYTTTMFLSQDASIIFAPVRASILGVRQGMEVVNKTMFASLNRMPLVIAAEGDQDYYGNPNPHVAIGPSWIPMSVVPRTDLAAFRIINATMWNDFPGGQTFEYNLANDGVNVTDFTFSSTYVPLSIQSRVWEYAAAVAEGTITVEP